MPFAMWTRALGGAHLSAQVGALLAMFFSGGGVTLGHAQTSTQSI